MSMPPEDMASTLAAAWVRLVRQTLGTLTSPAGAGVAMDMGAAMLSLLADALVADAATGMLVLVIMGWLVL